MSRTTGSTSPLEHIQLHADELRKLALEDEQLGRLSDRTVEIMREAQVIRMLQPRDHGGREAHPREFAETVMTLAGYNSAAGWVAGVVGVHPWELAMSDARLWDEVWGEDPDTWVASPYSPSGIAEPEEGGYRLSGRWSFSSGTDHCQWAFLGALVGDGTGSGKPAMPPQIVHVVLPRSDYVIIEDSWDVIGLSGTGSKDVVVDGAFIPEYRVRTQEAVMNGTAGAEVGRDEPLYRLPFFHVFPLGITAAVIGICEAGIAQHSAERRDRVAITGNIMREDPHTSYAAAEAASEVRASRLQLLAGVSEAYDRVKAGDEITVADRARARRDQVRCAWRAVAALDEVFSRSGGNALRRSGVIQRHWRDAHAGLLHMIHVPGSVYQADGIAQMGLEPPVELCFTL